MGNGDPQREIEKKNLPWSVLFCYSIDYEQLFGTIGFDGMSTNSYHEFRPTMVKEIRKQYSVAPKIAKANNIQSYRFRGFQVPPEDDYLESRKVVLTNADCNIILSAPKKSTTDSTVITIA